MAKSNVTVKVVGNGSAGVSDNKVAHVFIGNEYYSSFSFNLSWSKRDDNDYIYKMIEHEIFKRAEDTNISFERKSISTKKTPWIINYEVKENAHLSLEEVFAIRFKFLEYDSKLTNLARSCVLTGIGRNDDKRYGQKVSATFESVNREDSTLEVYYNDRETQKYTKKSFKKVKNPKCDQTYNKYIKNIASGLESHILKVFGIKIKVTGIPTYSEFEDANNHGSFHSEEKGRTSIGRIRFKYEIIEHDDSFLHPEFSNMTIRDFIDFSITYDYQEHRRGEFEVFDKRNTKILISLHEAVREFNRNPLYLHKMKEYEQEFIKDHKALKEIIIRNMVGWAHCTEMHTRGLYNFRIIMPDLYKVLFGDLHPSTIPCIFYLRPTVKEFDELINEHKLPTLEA